MITDDALLEDCVVTLSPNGDGHLEADNQTFFRSNTVHRPDMKFLGDIMKIMICFQVTRNARQVEVVLVEHARKTNVCVMKV